MEIVLPVVVGFCISFVATLLPGLLNMTAAKISLKEGRRNSVFFALGAATIVFFQAYISVTFAKLINRSPGIVNMLQEAGLVIFSLLTIYFLFLSKKKKKDINPDEVHVRSTTGNYFLGTMLSALNFFPIPYYVFVSVSLMSSGQLLGNNLLIFLFVLGAVMGSFAVFYLYIIFFKKFEHKTDFFIRNVNYFIGSITGIISIITIIKLLRNP
ncbi:LysE family transporter [Flavobacterium subsaxonicum]|uniref:Lysine transporter LysE n=1 Tax=Flavobacterium subsaxonicum WB 4.1-42 = DSM 21790 TaxID=1121898 RepID=A0A0A2MJ37_9FLAO|nr:LysE family transporter [Flavobacterium subsaxonicum]KGO91503.1 lysine transporter LysE [Flavobacterium subsaxonicum WB 4.1-42 = DSM 21790]